MGPAAYRFADFLANSAQKYWQILPFNPPTVDSIHCPYGALSAFAGDPLLISPCQLHEQGLLTSEDIKPTSGFQAGKVDFTRSSALKTALFDKAYDRFKNAPPDPVFQRFCSENAQWLDDYCLFLALRQKLSTGFWYDWPIPLRDRQPAAIESAKREFAETIQKQKFLQYNFFRQWSRLKNYCTEKGIKIIGDIPIYLAYDSADVWANPQFFKLDKNKKPAFVAGVPPDPFCKTGQLWSNPVYDWNGLKKSDFSWWIDRIKHNLSLFDMVRIDHFRAFVAYWQIPAKHKTAKKGKWIRAPKDSFFKKLFENVPPDSIIVEDLGFITPAVRTFVDKLNLSGMRILQWAFSGDKSNPHSIKNHTARSVVYTGTHDNNTLKGWFENELTDEQKQTVLKAIHAKPNTKNIHWKLIEMAMASRAHLAIIPMQDLLGLGEDGRMNRPGTIEGNWNWQITAGSVTSAIAGKLRKTTQNTRRSTL